MEYKELQCHEHGGTFTVPRKAGRPPRNCTEANPCDMAPGARARRTKTQEVAKRTAQTVKGKVPSRPARTAVTTDGGKVRPTKSAAKKRQTPREEEAKPATKSRPAASNVVVRHNPSVPLAKRAKDTLEPQGWNLKGRAWIDEDESAWAEVTGTRGEESIAVLFQDGKFYSQEYSIWDADKTAGQQRNPMPVKGRKLQFDPDEMTDSELAQELAGRTVTWWNGIAGATETAVIGDKFRIDHAFTGGNETARQVHFVDKTPNHPAFRSFNVDALMRVK